MSAPARNGKAGGARSFPAQIARGLLANSRHRRRVMIGLIMAASAMLMAGATFAAVWLHERPLLFLLFWFAVAWLTITALLMAVFDLLMVRKAGREAEKLLRRGLSDQENREDEGRKRKL